MLTDYEGGQDGRQIGAFFLYRKRVFISQAYKFFATSRLIIRQRVIICFKTKV